MNKQATVFGGTGFIGQAVVSRLARAGYTVRVPTRTLARAEAMRLLGLPGQVRPFVCDARDARQVHAAVAGASLVVNAVGILAETKRQTFAAVHADLPGTLARAAAECGARMVHISAIGADANSPSLYARSKAAGEGVVRAVLPQAAILRPSIVFGPGDSFFNRFARMAQMAPALPLIGGGHTRFQPVFVGDVAAAVMQAAARADARGCTFELGGPAIYTFRQLMNIMLGVTRQRRWLVALPWGAAMALASVLQRLPGQVLTRDQVILLRRDNIVTAGPGLPQLGIAPTALEAVLPTYLDAYRAKGRF